MAQSSDIINEAGAFVNRFVPARPRSIAFCRRSNTGAASALDPFS